MRYDDIPAELNALTERIIGCAIEVHRTLGPSLLERLYEQAFEHELRLSGLHVARQVPITLYYKGLELGAQLLDLVVEGLIVVELKAIERVADVHLAQLVSYLHSGNYPLGLLINFHVPVLRSGIHRRLNSRMLKHTPPSSASSAFPSASSRSD